MLYIIFTNELPEVIHKEVCLAKQSEVVRDRPVMSTGCLECGSLVCYADDSTYCTSDPDPQVLSRKLSDQYSSLANFLGANCLKVNDDKTHTLVLATSQLRRKRPNMNILVEIGGELNEPSEVERLLGAHVHRDMKWGEMVQNNDKSVVRALVTRTNALSKIAKIADFKTMKMIGNGIWLSKLIYMISVWGGTEGYLLTTLQKLQNRAARIICKRGRTYPAKKALKNVGWLTVKSLVDYHSLVQARKVLFTQQPQYLHEKLVGGRRRPHYATRLVAGGDISQGQEMQPRLDLTMQSWRFRVRGDWVKVPVPIRTMETLDLFKKELKKWLMAKQ